MDRVFAASYDACTHHYLFVSNLDKPVVRKTIGTSSTILHFHRNQQYSILALTDSSGNVSERYAYTAYGQPTFLNASSTVQTSSAANNRYTYTAREWDATLGLYHFRARWMSGLTGRFLTRDPIGYKGKSKNLYQYVRARPLDRRDPSGLYLIKEDYIPGTNVRPEWTNCAGFALHPNESAIDPILGLEGMLTGLGYTCQLGQSASGCLVFKRTELSINGR